MFVAREPKTITAVLGTASTLIRARAHGICRMVIVKPTTNTTSYDVAITDKYGYTVFQESDLVGEKALGADIPVFADLTLTISNASVDEDFDVMCPMVEHYAL